MLRAPYILAALTQSNWLGLTLIALLGLVGVWSVLNPGSFLPMLSGGRMPPSQVDLFFGRLVGFLVLTGYAWLIPQYVADPLLLYALSAVWVVAGAWGAVLLISRLSGLAGAGPETWQVPWHLVEGETSEHARVRYQAAWRKYRRLRVEFPLSVTAWFMFFMLLGRTLALLGWNQNIAGLLALAWIPVMMVLGWKWTYWQCPRCGNSFRGKTLFFSLPNRCYYCGLPKWAEFEDQ